MSISTNAGLRTAVPRPPRPCLPVVWTWREHHCRILSVRVVPACEAASGRVVCRAESRASAAHGVGHQRPSHSNPGVPALGRDALDPFCDVPYATAVGVGQNEHPLASVRGPDIGRA